MTDLEFMDHAEKLLLAVERSCDRINDATDADVDAQRSGGMVTLTFPNRSQIVINLQKPLHEVWMAARSGALSWSAHVSQGDGRASATPSVAEQVQDAVPLFGRRWRLWSHSG